MPPRRGDTTSLTLLGPLLAQAGTDQDWHNFYNRYAPLILGWCRSRGLQQSDSEDITAEVMRRLVGGISQYQRMNGDEVRKFRTWLYRVFHNTLCDHLRRWSRNPGVRGSGDSSVMQLLAHVEAHPNQGTGDVEELTRNLSAYLVDDRVRAFETVQKRHAGSRSWECYERVCLQEQDIAEAASAMGMKPTAVSSGAYRIRKEMNEEYIRQLQPSTE